MVFASANLESPEPPIRFSSLELDTHGGGFVLVGAPVEEREVLSCAPAARVHRRQTGPGKSFVLFSWRPNRKKPLRSRKIRGDDRPPTDFRQSRPGIAGLLTSYMRLFGCCSLHSAPEDGGPFGRQATADLTTTIFAKLVSPGTSPFGGLRACFTSSSRLPSKF